MDFQGLQTYIRKLTESERFNRAEMTEAMRTLMTGEEIAERKQALDLESLQAQAKQASQARGESGIHTRKDVELMRQQGIHAFLVGETFMRAADPGEALHHLFFNGVAAC